MILLPPIGWNASSAFVAPAFTFVTSVSGTAATITIPATAAVGDLAVLFDANYGINTPANATPSLWTSLINQTISWLAGSSVYSLISRVSYKKLDIGEPGSSISGSTGGTISKVLLIFHPSKSISAITPSTWLGSGQTGNPSSQTVSASGQTVPLIVFGSGSSGDDGTPTTPTFTTNSPSMTAITSNKLIVGYKIYNASPANHSIDIGDNGGGNVLNSGYIQATM